MSLLTYLSSLYHALEVNPPKEGAEEQGGPERDQEDHLDLGHSVEEDSICSSCSSSSGYASPVGKGRKEHQSNMKLGLLEKRDSDESEFKDVSTGMELETTKVKEAKEKFEKTIRRSGAEHRRESRRLVKSMCDENTQSTLGAKNPSLCDLGERETPFLVALRKFSSLASSQTKIPMARSCISYETNGNQDLVKGKYSTAPTVEDASTVAPLAFNSLITRATQTEEERQSAAVQTALNINMVEPTGIKINMVQPTRMAASSSDVNQNFSMVPSKTVKTHQRRTSIHSRQHAFQLPPHNQPHVVMLQQSRVRGECHGANDKVKNLQDLQSPHLSMQVLPQQEYAQPGLAVLPKYKRDARRSLRSNIRSSKSTPHLYLQSKKPSVDLQSYLHDHRPMGHMQHINGLPQTFSTLV